MDRITEAVVYTRWGCPYCSRALEALKEKGIPLREYDFVSHRDRFQRSCADAGVSTSVKVTVPQVFVRRGGYLQHVGGSDDLERYLESNYPSA